MPETFQALVVDKTDTFSVVVQPVTLGELPAGEVLIKVSYSSVNYKDGLASIPNGNILRNYPFIPGIDLSGIVVSSADSRLGRTTRHCHQLWHRRIPFRRLQRVCPDSCRMGPSAAARSFPARSDDLRHRRINGCLIDSSAGG